MDTDSVIQCVVEIPKGSRNKYEYDPALGAIRLDRFISSSVVYPTDYGFVPDTLALDGDPLDVMICGSEPSFPGCLVLGRLSTRTSTRPVTQACMDGASEMRPFGRSRSASKDTA